MVTCQHGLVHTIHELLFLAAVIFAGTVLALLFAWTVVGFIAAVAELARDRRKAGRQLKEAADAC